MLEDWPLFERFQWTTGNRFTGIYLVPLFLNLLFCFRNRVLHDSQNALFVMSINRYRFLKVSFCNFAIGFTKRCSSTVRSECTCRMTVLPGVTMLPTVIPRAIPIMMHLWALLVDIVACCCVCDDSAVFRSYSDRSHESYHHHHARRLPVKASCALSRGLPNGVAWHRSSLNYERKHPLP